MSGPTPELPAIQKLKGNPSKRAPRSEGPKPAGDVFIPEHVSDDAKACIEIVRKSMPPGIYAKVDSFALTGYAVAWALHKEAVTEMCKPEFEAVTKGSMGQETLSPWFKILNEQANQMKTWGDRLGLDPKSRMALAALAGPDKPKSKYGGLIELDG